jgi:hypothetical protein
MRTLYLAAMERRWGGGIIGGSIFWFGDEYP